MENKKLLAIFLTCCITLFITFVSLDIVKADSSTVELVDSSTLENGLFNDTQKKYIYYKSEFTSVKFESPYLNYDDSLAMSIGLWDYHYDTDTVYTYHLVDYDYFFKYEFDYRLVYSFSEWEVYINNLQVTELNDSTRPAGLKYGYLSFPIVNSGFIQFMQNEMGTSNFGPITFRNIDIKYIIEFTNTNQLYFNPYYSFFLIDENNNGLGNAYDGITQDFFNISNWNISGYSTPPTLKTTFYLSDGQSLEFSRNLFNYTHLVENFNSWGTFKLYNSNYDASVPKKIIVDFNTGRNYSKTSFIPTSNSNIKFSWQFDIQTYMKENQTTSSTINYGSNDYYKVAEWYDIPSQLYNFLIYLIFDMPLLSDIIRFFKSIFDILSLALNTIIDFFAGSNALVLASILSFVLIALLGVIL